MREPSGSAASSGWYFLARRAGENVHSVLCPSYLFLLCNVGAKLICASIRIFDAFISGPAALTGSLSTCPPAADPGETVVPGGTAYETVEIGLLPSGWMIRGVMRNRRCLRSTVDLFVENNPPTKGRSARIGTASFCLMLVSELKPPISRLSCSAITAWVPILLRRIVGSP